MLKLIYFTEITDKYLKILRLEKRASDVVQR